VLWYSDGLVPFGAYCSVGILSAYFIKAAVHAHLVLLEVTFFFYFIWGVQMIKEMLFSKIQKKKVLPQTVFPTESASWRGNSSCKIAKVCIPLPSPEQNIHITHFPLKIQNICYFHACEPLCSGIWGPTLHLNKCIKVMLPLKRKFKWKQHYPTVMQLHVDVLFYYMLGVQRYEQFSTGCRSFQDI